MNLVNNTTIQDTGSMQTSSLPLIFKDLGAARELFAKLGTLSTEKKTELKQHLQEAYVRFQQEPQALSEIFYMYGRCCYGGDMPGTSQILQNALKIELYKLGILDITLADKQTLEDHKTDFSDTDGLCPLLEDYLSKMSLDLIDTRLTSMDGESRKQLAFILKHLGFSLQNINTKNKAEPIANVQRFEKVYGLCRKLLDSIVNDQIDEKLTKDASWEIADLIYNTGRFMHKLTHPGDDKGAIGTLDEMIPYLDREGDSKRALTKKAQILNIKTIHISNQAKKTDSEVEAQGLLSTALIHVSEALEIAEKVEGFDSFLKTMFLNNKAYFSLKCNHENLEEIEGWLKEVADYAINDNLDHYYYSLFFLNYAEVLMRLGKQEDALIQVSNAVKVNTMFPESADVESVEKFKTKWNL